MPSREITRPSKYRRGGFLGGIFSRRGATVLKRHQTVKRYKKAKARKGQLRLFT